MVYISNVSGKQGLNNFQPLVLWHWLPTSARTSSSIITILVNCGRQEERRHSGKTSNKSLFLYQVPGQVEQPELKFDEISTLDWKMVCRVAHQTRSTFMMAKIQMLLLALGSLLPFIGSPFLADALSTRPFQRTTSSSRRGWLASIASIALVSPDAAIAAEISATTTPPNSDTQKLFGQARALESQGNMGAAQRLYLKVTDMAPDFVYGWSNLGNTQIALGDLANAEGSYAKAIDLCATIACPDAYLLFLNRGALRINNDNLANGLTDLQQAAALKIRPDAILLQNLARAEELNGLYQQADKDYSGAIQMTARDVAPFWLRSALVKLQVGDSGGAWDLFQRVNNRFPEAPEVRAAYAVLLWRKVNPKTSSEEDSEDRARQIFLSIPDRARLKYSDREYLTKTIGWPPVMRETVLQIAKAVGDS